MWLLIPPAVILAIHATLMAIDEFYFHRKRGLGRWEKLGHPVDSFFVFLCYISALTLPYNSVTIPLFLCVCFVALFIVTKDEWVHHRECQPGEQFVHSLLFILHPFVISIPLISWFLLNKGMALLFLVPKFKFQWITMGLWGQSALIASFMVYQIVYWNLVRSDPQDD